MTQHDYDTKTGWSSGARFVTLNGRAGTLAAYQRPCGNSHCDGALWSARYDDTPTIITTVCASVLTVEPAEVLASEPCARCGHRRDIHTGTGSRTFKTACEPVYCTCGKFVPQPTPEPPPEPAPTTSETVTFLTTADGTLWCDAATLIAALRGEQATHDAEIEQGYTPRWTNTEIAWDEHLADRIERLTQDVIDHQNAAGAANGGITTVRWGQ